MNYKEKILKELDKRLGEKCSKDISTCPKTIATDIFNLNPIWVDYEEDYWECDNCAELFEDIINISGYCPCDFAADKPLKLPSDVVVERVKEFINKK